MGRCQSGRFGFLVRDDAPSETAAFGRCVPVGGHQFGPSVCATPRAPSRFIEPDTTTVWPWRCRESSWAGCSSPMSPPWSYAVERMKGSGRQRRFCRSIPRRPTVSWMIWARGAKPSCLPKSCSRPTSGGPAGDTRPLPSGPPSHRRVLRFLLLSVEAATGITCGPPLAMPTTLSVPDHTVQHRFANGQIRQRRQRDALCERRRTRRGWSGGGRCRFRRRRGSCGGRAG